MSTLTENKKKKTAIRGLGAALVGFAGWVVLLLVFGLIDPNILKINNILNLLRSMAKYLLVGVGQSVILITGNIDLSIGSVVAMSAMISATLMSKGASIIVALLVALAACLVVGVINGVLVGKFKLPPFIATLGTMFCAVFSQQSHDFTAVQLEMDIVQSLNAREALANTLHRDNGFIHLLTHLSFLGFQTGNTVLCSVYSFTYFIIIAHFCQLQAIPF